MLVVGGWLILFSLLYDKLGFSKGPHFLGAAQIAVIEVGIGLIVFGVGFLMLPEENQKKHRNTSLLQTILNLPFFFWIILSFLLTYFLFFISPLFLSGERIQYFYKYIPNAWAPYIGFDIEMTVRHIADWLTKGISPYADGVVPYTPFALALFIPFISLGYPAYYKTLTLFSVVSYAISIFLLPLAFMRYKKYGTFALLGITGLFSYGFQFELERGQFNVIAFMFVVAAIYIFHKNNHYRYFAYILFSIAVQLKLYPLIFIFMLVNDWRDWKRNLLRFVGLGAGNFLLLFVLGFQNFQDFVTKIRSRANMQSSRYEDLSISGFSYQITEEMKILPTKYADALEVLFLFILAGIILVIIIHMWIKHEQGFNAFLFFFLTFGGLMIPAASFDYKLPILIAPMTIFLDHLSHPTRLREKLVYIVLVFLISLLYWTTLYPYEVNQVKPLFLARNSTALLGMFLLSIPVYFLQKRRGEASFSKRYLYRK